MCRGPVFFTVFDLQNFFPCPKFPDFFPDFFPCLTKTFFQQHKTFFQFRVFSRQEGFFSRQKRSGDNIEVQMNLGTILVSVMAVRRRRRTRQLDQLVQLLIHLQNTPAAAASRRLQQGAARIIGLDDREVQIWHPGRGTFPGVK